MTPEIKCPFPHYTLVATIDDSHGVYVVQHNTTREICVLKCLTTYDLSIYHYLINNPISGIPRTYELEALEDKLYIVEEYVPGTTLQTLIDQGDVFTEADVLNILHQLCIILNHLHSSNPPIIHRDIKPENIIMCPDNERICLVDMNISRYYSSSDKNRDTTLLGTPGYAAPEQYGFRQSTVETDIFSLGTLANILLTGHLPQAGVYNGKLRGLILHATQFDPDARFHSVQDMDRVIQHLMTTPYHTAIYTGYRRFFPPGLRTHNPPVNILATLGYIFLFYVSFATEFKGPTTAFGMFRYRLCFALSFLLPILYTGNYLEVADRHYLINATSRFHKILNIIICDAVLFILMIAIA